MYRSVERSKLVMMNPLEDIRGWKSAIGGDPADELPRRAEDDDDAAVARGALPNGVPKAIDRHASRATARERRGRRDHAPDAGFAQPPRFGLTPCVTLEAAGQHPLRQRGMFRGRGADLDRPYLTANRRDVFGVGDFFVPQEFGPGAVRRVGEVMRRPFAVGVPPACGLTSIGPQERIASIDLAKRDHVADSETSSRANWRTRIGPSSSGSQLPLSSATGARPSSSVRLRWNQRRTPISLYEPARSLTTSARKCSRAATSSGVSRSPDW